MIFAAVAAMAMVSVSNVFAFSGAQVTNTLAQVNDTVDTTVVKPATPATPAAAVPVAPVDTVAPADTTQAPTNVPQAPADTTQAPVADSSNVAK